MGTPKDSERTRARIIEAAGALFAEKGFKGITVRDIARSAETQPGALNYHFRSKEILYKEVVTEACRVCTWSSSDREKLLSNEPEEALRYLIKTSMESYEEMGDSNWQTVIITRECWEPNEGTTEIIENYFRNQIGLIATLLSRVVQKPSTDMQIQFAVMSLIGLMDTFGQYKQLIESVIPGLNNNLQTDSNLENQLYNIVVNIAGS